jgi:hypothetical protein
MKTNWIEDPTLIEKFSMPHQTLGEWRNDGTPEGSKTKSTLSNARELLEMTVDYLNVKLKELYGKDEDQPFTATISVDKLLKDNDDVVVMWEQDGETVYCYLFDNDRYRFAGEVYINKDHIYFTDGY